MNSASLGGPVPAPARPATPPQAYGGQIPKSAGRNVSQRPIPILPELAKIIEASPTGDLTILMTKWGKPFTANGFGGWFRDRCNEAVLPQCSAHGLRKAGAAIVAERGATDRQLVAMFGWESSRQAPICSAAADRKRLAAEAARLMASDHTANTDRPTELPHRENA